MILSGNSTIWKNKIDWCRVYEYDNECRRGSLSVMFQKHLNMLHLMGETKIVYENVVLLKIEKC
jgi:hypothetical protein